MESIIIKWTRNISTGSYIANRGGWVIQKRGAKFVLYKARHMTSFYVGTLARCKQEAQEKEDAADKLKALTPDPVIEPIPILVYEDDGNPNHEPEPEPEAVPVMAGHDDSRCRCDRIDFGQVCPSHGRKLRGGIATGSRWI